MADTLDLGNLLVHLNMNTTQYFAAMKGAEAQMRAFGNRLSTIGRQLSLRVTLPLLAIGAGSIKAFASFDDAMTKSLAIMNGVTPKLRGEMEDLATVMSNQSVTSATDLAKSYFFLASAGFDAEQSMASLNAVNEFAIAGNFDMALATDLATDAQSALGLTVKDAQKNMENMTRLTDVLVGANTLANATVQQFSEALTSQAGPAMKAYNIELEEGIAVIAAYADQGIKGQVAGSMFGRMIRLMTKGFKDNRGAWDQFKIDIFDSTGELKPLFEIIGDLTGALNTLSTEQKIAALELLGFKARSQQAILPLLGLQDRIKSYNEDLLIMGGRTKEVAEKNMASFTAQIKIFRNQIVNMARDIGQIIAPAILRMNEKIKVAVRIWGTLSEEFKKNLILWGGIAAAVGPMLIIMGSLLKVSAFMIGTITTLTSSFVALSIAMAGPLGIALLLAAIAFTLRAAWVQNFDVIKDRMQEWFDAFKEGFDWLLDSAVADTVVSFAKFWIDTFKFIKTNFRSFIGDLVGTLVGTASFIRTLGASIHDAIFLGLNFEDGIKKLREGISDAKEAFGFGFLDAADEATGKWDAFVESIKSGTETAKVVLTAFGQAEVEHLGALMDTLKAQFNQDADAVIALIKSKIQLLQEIAPEGSVAGLTPEAIAEVEAAIKSLENSVEDLNRQQERMAAPIREWAAQAADVATRVGEVFASTFQRMGDELADFLIDGAANFKDFAKSVIKDLLAIAIRAQFIVPLAQGLGFLTPATTTPAPVALASGGIVTSPTLAVIGEGGRPEAVIPLNGGAVPVRFNGGRQEAPTIIINNNTGSAFKQEGAPTFDGKNFIIGIVAENINQNGALRQLIGGINNFSG